MTKLYIGIFKDEDPVLTMIQQYQLLSSNKKTAILVANSFKKYKEEYHPDESSDYELYEIIIRKTKGNKNDKN